MILKVDEVTLGGLKIIKSISNNMVASISKLHFTENNLTRRLNQSTTANQETNLGNIFDLQSLELLAARKKVIHCLDPAVDFYEDILVFTPPGLIFELLV